MYWNENRRLSAKAGSREASENCLLPDNAGCVTILATFLQLCYPHFFGHSCTHVRGPPVALHVSQQISSESWGFSDVAAVSRYTPRAIPPPPQKALSHLSPFNCQGCRTSSCLWKGVAPQGGVAATLADVVLHCATMNLGPSRSLNEINPRWLVGIPFSTRFPFPHWLVEILRDLLKKSPLHH